MRLNQHCFSMYLRLKQVAPSRAGSQNPDLQRPVTDHPCMDEADKSLQLSQPPDMFFHLGNIKVS